MIAQDFPAAAPLTLPGASLPPEPVVVDLRPILELLAHNYRMACEWGHHARAAAYREALHAIRLQYRQAAAKQTSMSKFVPLEE